MSEAFSSSTPSQDMQIFGQLFPKVIANHISKLPEFESMPYSSVLDLTQDESMTMQDRLARISSLAGQASLTDELNHEVGILWLCAAGRESEVIDADRQAAYAKSDRNQILHADSELTLDHYLSEGIEVIFERDARVAAREFCQLDERDVPYIEKLKAKRLVNINGFDNSRIMYAVHDIVDHAWLFKQMRDFGLYDKYADLLQRVEMTDSSFLYSRQAELLASVGFGSRRWHVARDQGEHVVLTHEQIDNLLASIDDPRTAQARELLGVMSPAQRQQALFMIENMAIQFTDERRRWGAVKQSGDFNRTPMPLLDPLYIAMMIDALVLVQHSDTYNAVQLAATLAVETMLTSAVTDDASESRFTIPIPIDQGISMVKFDDKRADWIAKHLSVSTSYNRIG